MGRLFDTDEAHPGVYHLLCNQLSLLNGDAARHACTGNALAFRLKLLLAAGFAPHLAACASCGGDQHLAGFSPAAGGVVCEACEAGSFALHAGDARLPRATRSGAPLADSPLHPSPRALQQAERAISETLEHHANVRFRTAAAQPTTNTRLR